MMPEKDMFSQYVLSQLSPKERAQQTQLVMRLFDLWQLTTAQCALLLGLSPHTATSIHRYKTGKACLPQYRDIQDRVRLLLAIHRYLHRAYPDNPELSYQWMTTQNADFTNLPPIDIVIREGYLGLVKVKAYLSSNQE